ncbi:hypothetical protein B4096_0629 [Heyndrickxia coagulans]|uniref:Uncharacterized protein n=1 Tax=Heyndrickxia coagulans TaxID=1398 RepID=A0AAN0T929_HEYCO|nr:hypothetical protein SB48_HM08orf05415 [Heyndrickxia coagulans]KYC77667.1 hypothetical protein B4096_0629 [Heyndrickxia coagulans]
MYSINLGAGARNKRELFRQSFFRQAPGFFSKKKPGLP